MQYITASCIFRNNHIYQNGQLAWMPSAADPTDFLLAVYQHFGFQYPKFYKMDQLCKLGWLAAELLLSKGFHAADYRPEDVAVVLSNAHSSLDTDIRYFATVKEIPSPALFVYTLPNIMIGEISIRHGLKGENALFITESFDAAFIERYVGDLMETGNVRACVCGWVDVSGENYAAALFLIESRDGGIPFSAERMINLFNYA